MLVASAMAVLATAAKLTAAQSPMDVMDDLGPPPLDPGKAVAGMFAEDGAEFRDVFSFVDLSRDGIIQPAELAAFLDRNERQIAPNKNALLRAEFARLDGDADGQLEFEKEYLPNIMAGLSGMETQVLLEEVTALELEHFQDADLDGDSGLSLDEYVKRFGFSEEATRIVSEADTDQGGGLSLLEFARAGHLFHGHTREALFAFSRPPPSQVEL